MYYILFVLQKGAKAPQAAGKIHTDFEKGFIMAEVMKYDDFKNEGTEAAVKVFDNYYLGLHIIHRIHAHMSLCSFITCFSYY